MPAVTGYENGYIDIHSVTVYPIVNYLLHFLFGNNYTCRIITHLLGLVHFTMATTDATVVMTSSYNCEPQAFYEDKCLLNTSTRAKYHVTGECVQLWTSSQDIDVNGLSLELECHEDIWKPEVIQRIVTLIFIMTLTLIGNIIIIIVLTCSKYRKLNSRVNIFIINLAIGDLTVCCFTMTTEALFVVFEGAWVLGPIACKVLLYIQTITLASTTFILVAMSCDRFLAICRPLNLPGSRARKSIIFAWIMALVFASPQLLIFKEVPDGIYSDGEIKLYCKSRGYTAWWQRKLYITMMASYILIIPTIVISFCYINVVRVVWRQGKNVTTGSGVTLRRTSNRSIPRAKVKTVKMTLSIILSFIMCWTPYFVVHLIHVWSDYKYDIPETVYVFAETMALLNSALNPILYGCFNIKLKRGLMEIFCPDRIRTDVNQSFATRKQATVDYHCMNVVKNASRCTKAPSTSSNSSHKGDRDPPGGGGRSKETVVDTGDGKNGYKLRVRFFKSDEDNCNIVCPTPSEVL